jgi:hypothetical protein
VALQLREQSFDTAIGHRGKQLFEIFLCEPTIRDTPGEETSFSLLDPIES